VQPSPPTRACSAGIQLASHVHPATMTSTAPLAPMAEYAPGRRQCLLKIFRQFRGGEAEQWIRKTAKEVL